MTVRIDWEAPQTDKNLLSSTSTSTSSSSSSASKELQLALTPSLLPYSPSSLSTPRRDQVVASHASHDAEVNAFLLLVEKHQRRSEDGTQQQNQNQNCRGSSSRDRDRGRHDDVSSEDEEDEEDKEEDDANRLAVRALQAATAALGGLSLADCLSAFTKEEKLEDESW